MFDRVLVANRGEIAVRVIRALHELGIEAVAVYSTADRDALHVELADQAVCIGPPGCGGQLPARFRTSSPPPRRRAATPCIPATGSSRRTPAFVRACDDNDLVFIGPPADVVEQMGDKVRAKEAMRAAGVPLVPGSDGTGGLDALRAAAAAAGFPVLLKAAAGGGGKGHASRRRRGRARARVLRRERRGGRGVRRRRALRREARLARPSRRDPGALRRRRRRAHARRARVLDPAAAPEADRGVAVGGARRDDARGDGGYGRARMRGDRLPQRRHLRVPRRPGRRVLLHRGELPPPGRASRVRAGDRDRHRARADPDRRGRAARRDRPRAAAWPRDRDAHQRRGSRRAASFRRPGTITRFRPPLGPGVRVDTAVADRIRDPAVLRLDDREGDRLGRRRARRRLLAPSARCASSSSRASRRRATSRSTSSPRRSSAAATTRRRRSPSSRTASRRSSA